LIEEKEELLDEGSAAGTTRERGRGKTAKCSDAMALPTALRGDRALKLDMGVRRRTRNL